MVELLAPRMEMPHLTWGLSFSLGKGRLVDGNVDAQALGRGGSNTESIPLSYLFLLGAS